MNKIKVRPLWVDVMVAIAQDFESYDETWEDFNRRTFITGTDIYELFQKNIKQLGLKSLSKINFDKTQELAMGMVFEYGIEVDDEQTFLVCSDEKNPYEKIPLNVEKKDLDKEIKSKLNTFGFVIMDN